MENNDAYEPVEVLVTRNMKPKEKVGPKSSVSSVDSYGTPFPSQRYCKVVTRVLKNVILLTAFFLLANAKKTSTVA